MSECLRECVGAIFLQRQLSKVSDEDWLNIPEVGDSRNKRHRNSHIRPDR